MIVGEFDDQGRPFVDGRLAIPNLRVDRSILFLLDTGADITCLHTRDSRRVHIPFSALRSRTYTRGIGGVSRYFRETAIISFSDGPRTRYYVVELYIAEPSQSNENLPSLLGRNIINNWYMQYDPANGRLEFTVRHADHTIG